MPVDRELYRAVDYIMNRASDQDLDVIKAAIERRARDNRRRVSAAGLRGSARDLGGAVSQQLAGVGDVKEMTRQYIREMVHRLLPAIPAEHLELMLEEWIPDAERHVAEENLPRDVVRSMVVQFVDYSVGRMNTADRAELTGDWSRRYWGAFSERTRSLIRELLMGAVSEKDFWERFDEGEA
jgi:hypothetical protein